MARTLQLSPGVRPLRRGAGQVQVARTGVAGLVVEGLTDAEVGAVMRLAQPVDETSWLREVTAAGVAPQRAADLLAALERHGLLLPADQRSVRPSGRVVVEGSSTLAGTLHRHLRQCGHEPPGSGAPALAVLVVSDVVAPHAWRPWLEASVPHLPVVLGPDPVVGPLVRPDGGPCLLCLDLHRTDRDPAWPRLMAQLAVHRPERDVVEAADPVAALLAAAVCTALARAHLQGAPVPSGVSWQLRLPWPEVGVRAWTVHPRCPHHGRR